MKKTITIILSVILFSAAFAQKESVKDKPKLTSQDSMLLMQQQVNRFVDSLIGVTSLKTLRDFLQSSVSFKEYNESSFVVMYDFFVRTKVELWLQEKNKSKKPPSN